MQEIFQDVAVEAIAHADRFTVGRRPLPWLLGIAVKIIRRRKVTDAKCAQRELTTSTITLPQDDFAVETSPLDQTVDGLAADQFTRIEDDAEAEALLALVPEADRNVLRLAVAKGGAAKVWHALWVRVVSRRGYACIARLPG